MFTLSHLKMKAANLSRSLFKFYEQQHFAGKQL